MLHAHTRASCFETWLLIQWSVTKTQYPSVRENAMLVKITLRFYQNITPATEKQHSLLENAICNRVSLWFASCANTKKEILTIKSFYTRNYVWWSPTKNRKYTRCQFDWPKILLSHLGKWPTLFENLVFLRGWQWFASCANTIERNINNQKCSHTMQITDQTSSTTVKASVVPAHSILLERKNTRLLRDHTRSRVVCLNNRFLIAQK